MNQKIRNWTIAGNMALCFLLVTSILTVNVMAETQQEEKVQEHCIDLDKYLNNFHLRSNISTYSTDLNKPAKPNADGGYFWVDWSTEKFIAKFDHDSKPHRVSVQNSNMKEAERSEWCSPGVRARKECYITSSGNKAFWATEE